MAQNNTQKVIRNILRLCYEKDYSIEFIGVNYNRHISKTKDYQYVRKVYKNYSTGYINIFKPSELKGYYDAPYASFEYSIAQDKIISTYSSSDNGLAFLKEAQFLSDIGM